MRRQFHALRLATGKRGGGLAQPQIAEPDFFQHPQLLHHLGYAGEEVQRLFHRQVQHFVDILAAITHVEHLRLVARAFALFADQFDVGQKLHFDGDGAVALAGFAASAGDVEREMSGGEAALLGLRQGSKQIADSVEGLDVGHRIRSRSAPDGRLVDQDHVVDEIVAFQFAPISRRKRARHCSCPSMTLSVRGCFLAADKA